MTNTAWRGKRWLTSSQTAARYGVHRTTLARWLKDEALGFPKPADIRRRIFWDEAPLDAWDQARAGRDYAADLAARRPGARRSNPQPPEAV